MSVSRPGWPDFSGRGSLVLPLPRASFESLPGRLDIDGLQLEAKREFHVTLCDRALAARLHEPRAGGAVAARLPPLFAALDWQWRASGERWLLLEAKPEGVAHSVIELIDMPAFAQFRAQVGALLGEALPATPAHVTLYVAGDPVGIGIPSAAAFERLRLRRL